MNKTRRITILIFCFLTASYSCKAQKLYLKLKIQLKDSSDSHITTTREFIDYEILTKAIQKSSDSLQKNGYFDAIIRHLSSKNDSLYIAVIEAGKKIPNLRLRYTDSVLASYAKKRGILIKNDDFLLNTTDFETLMADFTARESRSGFPLSSFQLKNTVRKNDTLIANLILNRENFRRIDKITINGYEKFPQSYLRYYAGLKPGITFDRLKINEKVDDLDNLPFLTSLKDPEVLFERDSTGLFLYLEKSSANRFDGFLGFGNSEDSGRLRLDGYLDLHLLNNLNFGELFELNYKSDGNDQQTLRVALETPYLFKTPLGLQAELNLFRRDTTFSTTKQELGLFYQLTGNSRLSSAIFLENSTALNENTTIIGDSISDYKKTHFAIGFSRISRSREPLFPIKNAFVLRTAFGNRTALGQTENQFAVEGDASYTFMLSEKQHFAINNITKNLISERYVNNELFRFGGINSVRGFKENAINANFYSVFRTEYRYLAAPGLYIHSIADAAYFENELLEEQGFLYSFGFGAGILTGAGLLNINLANGLQEDQDFKFSNSILHLRLTVFF